MMPSMLKDYHSTHSVLRLFLIFISYPVHTVQTTVQAKGFDAFLYLPVEANRTCGMNFFYEFLLQWNLYKVDIIIDGKAFCPFYRDSLLLDITIYPTSICSKDNTVRLIEISAL